VLLCCGNCAAAVLLSWCCDAALCCDWLLKLDHRWDLGTGDVKMAMGSDPAAAVFRDRGATTVWLDIPLRWRNLWHNAQAAMPYIKLHISGATGRRGAFAWRASRSEPKRVPFWLGVPFEEAALCAPLKDNCLGLAFPLWYRSSCCHIQGLEGCCLHDPSPDLCTGYRGP
jgi:hypothetical protein